MPVPVQPRPVPQTNARGGISGEGLNTFQNQLQQWKNPHPSSQGATDAARQAVMGLSQAGPPGQGAHGAVGGDPIAGEGSYYTVDAQGNTSYSATPNFLGQKAGLQRQQSELEASLRDKSWQSRFGALSGLVNKQGGGAAMPREQIQPQTITREVMDPDSGEQAANQAALARAKDTAGQIGRSAMNSLSDVMGARGMGVSSGLGLNEAGGIIGEGARQVGDVNREQQIQALAHNRARASEQYQGNLTQRGQDLSQSMGQYQGQIQQRGQDIEQQRQRQASLWGLLNSGLSF